MIFIPQKQGLTVEDGAEHGDQRVLPDRLGARVHTRSSPAGRGSEAFGGPACEVSVTAQSVQF